MRRLTPWLLLAAAAFLVVACDDDDPSTGDTMDGADVAVDATSSADGSATSSDASSGDDAADTGSSDASTANDASSGDTGATETCLLCVDLDTCVSSGGGIGTASCPAGFVCCQL